MMRSCRAVLPTFAVLLLLAAEAPAGFSPVLTEQEGRSTIPAACGDERGLVPGLEVILSRHPRLAGGDQVNWLPAMEAWVGARTTVRRVLAERDLAGCVMAVVEADDGRFSWRVADLEIVTARPGWGDWPGVARKMLLEGDADGSGSLDAGEVAALGCPLLARVDASHRARVPLSVRIAFGFPAGAARYRGETLGIVPEHRAAADARFEACGIEGGRKGETEAAPVPDAAAE
jgi:hypothetical protein